MKVTRLIINTNDPKTLKSYWSTFWKAAKLLKEHLGCLLFQFNKRFAFTEKSCLKIRQLANICSRVPRKVLEFRNKTWFTPQARQFLSKLEASNWSVAIVHVSNRTGWVDDLADGFNPPIASPIIGNTLYIRLHGTSGQYTGGYTNKQLKTIAEFAHMSGLPDVYIYFNNTDDMNTKEKLPNAIVDAKALKGTESL